jgi:DNA-binding response OmpR family regulator
VLEKSGYTVLTASSGEDGLRVAGGHAGKIDLVLTDMVMPGMNGRQLAKRLREADPELLVLYSSGYTENVFGVEGLSPDWEGYLQKPFTPASLEGAVAKLLDRGPGAAET